MRVTSSYTPDILAILTQIKKGEAKTENVYTRAVTPHGNKIAQMAFKKVYEVVDAEWRGIGVIPDSGFELQSEYDAFNIRKTENLSKDVSKSKMPNGCRCADVILGKIMPEECTLFLNKCTPENPVGPCMVGIEGTCQIHAKYGGHLKVDS